MISRTKRIQSIFAIALLPVLVLIFFPATRSYAYTVNYHYDALNRLEEVIYPGGTNIRYTYDNVGNRLSQDVYQMSVSLSATPASPQPYGTAVTFTGAASGGSGTYEYEFQGRLVGGVWGLAQTYSTNPSWTWSSIPGTYEIKVNARNAGSSAAFEGIRSITYMVTAPPVSGVSLSVSPESPQLIGTTVTFPGAASGGSGMYEYMFWGRLAGAPFWSPAQNYSTNSSWTWNTAGVFMGTYEIRVGARNIGSTAEYEATQTTTYTITGPPVTGVTLTASPSSPVNAGTNITFTGAASGGTGIYEYEFQGRSVGGAWGIAQTYSTTPTWTWTGVAGSWEIKVNARSAGSTAEYEAAQTIPCDVSAP